MATDEQTRGELTPAKIAAIAILSIVLVVVIVVQSSDGTSDDTISLNPDAVSASTFPQTGAPATVPDANSSKSSPNWPNFSREEAQSFNPFIWGGRIAASTETSEPEANQPLQTAQSLQVHKSREPDDADTLDEQNKRKFAGSGRDGDDSTTTSATGSTGSLSDYRRERRRALDELRKSRVGMLVLQQDESRALVDDRVVRIGDVIDGFIVTEINARGVLFVDQQPEPEE